MVSDATQEWFSKLVSDTQQRLGALSSLQDDPERFLGRSEQDGVTAVVAPGGNIVDLTLSRNSLLLGPEELAATILRTQREAARRADTEYAGAVQAAVGGEFDVNAILASRLDPDGLRTAAEGLAGSGR
ncbi:hypothetical protein [Actinoplanes awajinensis]|uniref:YbaB/EbfC DNA-binding family protein n=1 Tax=Actinoplanes awajinensis subsp. mycoplanecinus TaxID=135947 RepID=A0A0X3V7C0_9ACTN|nr:hypothetical protein [Actinoplanes awajinensis]KUL40630.1 hypothetical protein ADL15_06485 [Actinoplanes awajinensis subsp. mycoplanecinus]